MCADSAKPDWWPRCPYPESVFGMTIDEYVQAVPDPHLRTAISGLLARIGWQVASETIWERYADTLAGGEAG